MTEQKLMNPLWDQGFRRRTSLSMMYASAEAHAPLVMTLGGYPDVPDILEMVSDDGTKREYAIVDRVRFERLQAVANTAHTCFASSPKPVTHETRRMYEDLADATVALQPGDLDPLP